MKYLSTFTGLGGFEIAIHNVFPKATCVGYSEIDPFANKIYLKNFPKHAGLNLGDIKAFVHDTAGKNWAEVNDYRVGLLPDFDLLVGGPPCTDLSVAKSKRQGLLGKRSGLFYCFEAILKLKQPQFFLMENVASMPTKDRDIITELLGVEPVRICSDKFTPQKRERLYWFNWKMPPLPEENGPRWDDLVAWSRSTRYPKTGKKYVEERETRDGRANTLTTGMGCGSFSSKNYIGGKILSPYHCEELQGLPVGWTEGVSNTQRYKQIGNAVTAPVIEHILRGLQGLI